MAIYIKRGKDDNQVRSEDRKIAGIVADIIKDIEVNGDAAVRKYSEQFDHWSPESFRLTKRQIEEAIASLPDRVIKDIQFAQAQIRNFARRQKEAIVDIEVETLPGVILGHKNIPVSSAGCYIPGGRYPMIASAHMSIITAKEAGVERVMACTPALKGKLPAETVVAMHMAGADEI